MKLRKFEDFLNMGIVKRQTPNKQRALALVNEAENKEKFLNDSLKIMPSEKMNSNFIIDSCYDIIMEFIRARLFIEGYNVGNTHEAEISYMRNLNFPETDIIFMDELRYYRNGVKYYGTILDKEYSEKVLRFFRKIYPILKIKIEESI